MIVQSWRASSLAMIAGSFCGDFMRSCLFTLNWPNTTVMSFVLTPNSPARNFTMKSVALPFSGEADTLILS